MFIAHKIELALNDKQKTYCSKACGTARFAYNWALFNWNEMYSAWKLDNSLPRPSEGLLRKKLNSIKREDFPWMREVTKCAPQLAIMDLGKAFVKFWKGETRYPKFKSKSGKASFSVDNNGLKVSGNKVKLPHLGWVKMKESLRFEGRLLGATISRRADRWFISLKLEILDGVNLKSSINEGVVGVDLGIITLATLSTGEKIEGPRPLKKYLKKLKRLSKAHSRKRPGSANRKKAQMKLARLHLKISNIRNDALHKLTTDLTSRFHTIVIEDLNVSGMIKNKKLSRSIQDMGFFEFKRQLQYKSAWRGGRIIIADRWFPSSKLCSSCGYRVDSLPLSIREWSCPSCGSIHDRDINAAINLAAIAVSSTVKVWGEGSSGLVSKDSSETTLIEPESLQCLST